MHVSSRVTVSLACCWVHEISMIIDNDKCACAICLRAVCYAKYSLEEMASAYMNHLVAPITGGERRIYVQYVIIWTQTNKIFSHTAIIKREH